MAENGKDNSEQQVDKNKDKKDEDERESMENKVLTIFETLKEKKTPRETFQKIAREFDVEYDKIDDIDAKAICEQLRNDTPKSINESKRENVSCNEVLQKCSGGVCLKGFFYKGAENFTHSACREKTLIGLKKEISFQFSRLAEREIHFKFENEEKHFYYLKTVEALGFSFAQQVCASCPILGINKKSQNKSDEEKDSTIRNTDSTKSYGTITSVVVPVAQWEPHIQDICLSENAIYELVNIENLLQLEQIKPAESKCLEFFTKFGSHLCIGNIHFGGIQNFTTVLDSISFIEKSKIKEIVCSEHCKYLSGLLSKFGLAKVSGDYSDEGIKQLGNVHADENQGKRYRTTSTIHTIGGPSEVHTTYLWKLGVIYHNTTWAMIDRQCQESCDFVGVWNMVLAEGDRFKHPEMLYHFLLNEWRKHTGLDVFDDGQLMIWKEKQFSTFIDEIKCKYLERNNKFLFLEMIRLLSEKISELRKNGHLQIWMKHIREEKSVCKEIVKVANENNSLINDYKFQFWFWNMFSDVHDMDFDASKEIQRLLDVFHQKSKVLSDEPKEMDVEMICNFITSGALLQKAQDLTDMPICSIERPITKLLRSYAVSWLKSMKKMPEQYILLTSVLMCYHYNYIDQNFECLISVENLLKLTIDLKSSYEKFARISPDIKSKQAFSLLLLMKMLRRAYDCEESFKENFINTWNYMKSELEIHPDILLLMREIKRDFTQTETSLKRIEEGSELHETLTWKYFETCNEQKKEISDTGSIKQHVEITPGVKTLLSRLYLSKFYADKIKICQVLQIDEDADEITMKTLPWQMLHKIISLDQSFRDSLLAQLGPVEQKINWFKKVNEIETTYVDANDEQIHPSDLLCAVYLCCDSHLQGLLVRKLVLLKFAVPFTFSLRNRILLYLWPLRRIYFEDKLLSVMSERLQYVACLRYGTLNSVSKSGVLNELLSPIKHDTFYHRGCEHGKRRRDISNGMIEIAWDVSKCNITGFFNLRGDARDFGNEAILSFSLSSVVVVFLDSECIESLKTHLVNYEGTCNLKLILVTIFPKTMSLMKAKDCLNTLFEETNRSEDNTEVISVTDFQSKEIMDTKTLVKTLRSTLYTMLERMQSESSLDKQILERADRNLFDIDEDEDTCKSWKISASCFFDDICSNFADRDGSLRFSITPLQGEDLWEKISEISKDMHKEPQLDRYNVDETKKKAMQTLRRKQISICNNASQITAKFVDILINAEEEKELHYFLSWLEFFLHRHFKLNTRSDSLEECSPRNLFKFSDSTEKVSEQYLELEQLFREMGQIYEAFMFCSENSKTAISQITLSVLHQMPVIMAKLLLSGKAVELLDGFTNNIPLLWLKAIFKEVEKLLPDKKIVSLSVIGIQSSGKSTMLNTMFGVEFHVSAGKCTRGIYMKLLPVKKCERINNIDYIMIFDTEGLRAPENSDDCHHDNELSTMVIGMADIALVNIMGETMSDMMNVLQIVVYALVRIRLAYKNMNIHPTCLFVHQNTVDGEAVKKETLKISGILDYVAEIVADQEHMKGVTHFKDVIKFDPDFNVIHVSNLWLGKPPMAPVSNSYSKDIARVKSNLLSILSVDELCTLSIFEVFERIQNTWYAVQSEDFIFSFRNSLEVKAYLALETRYRRILNDLENCHFDFIMSIRPVLCRCTADKMNAEVSSILQKYTEKMMVEKANAWKTFSEYIDGSRLKKIMSNWETAKEKALEMEISSLSAKFTNKLQNDAHIYKVKNSYSDSDIQKRALIAVSDLAEELKANGNSYSDEKNLEEFNNMWSNVLNDIAPKTPLKDIESKKSSLLVEIKQELLVLFKQHSNLLANARKESDVEHGTDASEFNLTSRIKNDDFRVESTFWKDYIISKLKNNLMQNIPPPHSLLLNLLEKIAFKIDTRMNELASQDIEYDIHVYKNIMNIVTRGVEDNNQHKKKQIVITHKGQIHFAIYVSRYLYKEFCQRNKIFDSKHSLHTWLSSRKNKAREYFFCMLKEREEAEKISVMIIEDIKRLITCRIEEIVPRQIEFDVKNNFAVTKYQFLCDYLIELAKLGKFDHYVLFLDDPANGAFQRLNSIMNDYLFKVKEGNQSCFEKIVEKKINNEIKEIKEATYVASETYGQIFRDWIELFCKKLKHLEFEHGYAEHLSEDAEEVEVQTFKMIFLKMLPTLKNELTEAYQSSIYNEKDSFIEKISTEVFQDFWGCKEQCPWCGEPCQYDRNHLLCDIPHRCIQHRPEALKGFRWVWNEKLVFETCNWLVNSTCRVRCSTWCSCSISNKSVLDELKKYIPFFAFHPYKEYKKYIPLWDIPPSFDMSASPYWCWFIVQYHEDIQKLYKAKAADIPDSWRDITQKKAIESIRLYIQDPHGDK